MAKKNNNNTIVKEDAELIRFQFTDDTRQTLESVTVFLKDRFAEYGYLPETDVIPIEWIKRWAMKSENTYNREQIVEMLNDWGKENE